MNQVNHITKRYPLDITQANQLTDLYLSASVIKNTKDLWDNNTGNIIQYSTDCLLQNTNRKLAHKNTNPR